MNMEFVHPAARSAAPALARIGDTLRPPPAPAPTRGGVPLHQRPLSLPGAGSAGDDRPAVLLLHGLCGTPLELTLLARRLHDRGWRVEVPYLRGYGTDVMGDSRRVTPWMDWAAQTRAAWDALRAAHRRVAVGGLCIGAVLALHLATELADETGIEPAPGSTDAGAAPDALALLSPTLHFDGWNVPWYQPLLPLAYHTPLRHRWRYREREPFGLKNDRLRRWVRSQMQTADTSDAGAAELSIPSMFQARRLIAATRARLHRVVSPCLALHAVDDDMATPRSSREVLQRVASPVTRYVELRDSFHMISMDNDREQVARETCTFFAAHAGLRDSRI